MQQSVTPPIQPLDQPEQPASPPKRKLPPLLVGILLIVLVGILGSITFFLNMSATPQQSTPDVTQNPTAIPTPTIGLPEKWDTYTNNTYGFSFVYPADWKRVGTQLAVPLPAECQTPQDCEGFTSSVLIEVSLNTNQRSLRDFIVEKEFDQALDDGENEEMASRSALTLTQTYEPNLTATDSAVQSMINTKIPGDWPITKVFYMKGQTVISLQFDSINMMIIQRMLSSFTFTK